MSEHESVRQTRQEGFALILAILALMLLTFLGLTLATTTSQELQIAANHRWGRQALFNAEAGAELAKAILQGSDWSELVYPARTTSWTLTSNSFPAITNPTLATATVDKWGNALRNYENGHCDELYGRAGYGAVLQDGTSDGPYQYLTAVQGQSVNGAFTIWIRRAITFGGGGSNISDDSTDSKLIITVEGVAPFHGQQAGGATGRARQSVRLVEMEVGDGEEAAIDCASRTGQAGGGAKGSGMGGCTPIDADRVAEGLGLAGVTEVTDSNTGSLIR